MALGLCLEGCGCGHESSNKGKDPLASHTHNVVDADEHACAKLACDGDGVLGVLAVVLHPGRGEMGRDKREMEGERESETHKQRCKEMWRAKQRHKQCQRLRTRTRRKGRNYGERESKQRRSKSDSSWERQREERDKATNTKA